MLRISSIDERALSGGGILTSSGIILREGAPRSEASHGWSSVGIFSFGWACVLILVAAFALHAGTTTAWLLAIPLLSCLFLLQISAPVLGVSLLAGPLLLGPIARMTLPGGLLLHVGDIAIGIMALAAILRQGQRTALPLGSYEIPILFVIMLVLVGWIAGLDPVASTPSMVALLETLAVFVLTNVALTKIKDVDTVILGWVAAVGLGALLVIFGYLRREPLLIGSGTEAQKAALSTIASASFLYRATFFVTGFGYPLAAAILCSTMWIVAKKGSSALRLALAAGLLLDVVAVGLMGGATVGGAVAIGLLLLAFWTLWLPRGFQRVAILGFVLLAGAGVVTVVLTEVMSSSQLKLLLGRTQSVDSLVERFKVWKNVVEFLLTNPHAMLIGLGPDISIRRGDYPLLRQLFYGAGVQQNAVDSGYLYLLLNYGIFVTLLLVGVALRTLTRLTKLIVNSPDPTAIAIWLSISVWLVLAVTQQGGVSKPLFITAQFVALGSFLYSTSVRPPRLSS